MHKTPSGSKITPIDDGKTELEAKTSIKEAIELMVEDLGKEKGYGLKFVRKY